MVNKLKEWLQSARNRLNGSHSPLGGKSPHKNKLPHNGVKKVSEIESMLDKIALGSLQSSRNEFKSLNPPKSPLNREISPAQSPITKEWAKKIKINRNKSGGRGLLNQLNQNLDHSINNSVSKSRNNINNSRKRNLIINNELGSQYTVKSDRNFLPVHSESFDPSKAHHVFSQNMNRNNSVGKQFDQESRIISPRNNYGLKHSLFKPKKKHESEIEQK